MRVILAATISVLLFVSVGICAEQAGQKYYGKYPKIRNATGYSESLNDIESHIRPGHVYADGDKVTHAHETTHGISSHIRMKHGHGIYAIYLLKDDYFFAPNPRVTISAVAQKVPRSMRCDIYNLYVVSQQRYWNNEPIYLLEEMVAYMNGAIVGIEYGMERRATESLDYAHRMLNFVIVLAYLSKQDTSYNCEPLYRFMEFCYVRLQWATRKIEEKGWDSSRSTQALRKLQTSPDAAWMREFLTGEE